MYALLVKPGAFRSKKNSKAISKLIASGATLIGSETASSIREEIRTLLETEDELTIVACGGDGTVNLALNSTFGLPVSLAVVPMGTGNDFARYLGIKNLRLGIAALYDENLVSIDVGKVVLDTDQVRYFAGIASCGFDAQVNERANGYRGPSGTFKYLAAVVAELRSLSARQFQVRVDGDTHQDQFTLVAIANTSSYGGGMRVCPTANAFDGKFEITYVSKVSRTTLIRVLPRVFWGGHVKHPKVSQTTGCQVNISGEQFLVYADGERIGAGPAQFELLRGAVRVRQASSSQSP